MGVRTAVGVGVSAVIAREKLNLSELPWEEKSPLDFSTVTTSVSQYPAKASFSCATGVSVESSITIVNDDDSAIPVDTPTQQYFKFKLSIM